MFPPSFTAGRDVAAAPSLRARRHSETVPGPRPPCPQVLTNASTFRSQLAEMSQPLRPYERVDTLKQFLDHDRHVLRFLLMFPPSFTVGRDVAAAAPLRARRHLETVPGPRPSCPQVLTNASTSVHSWPRCRSRSVPTSASTP